MFAMHRALLSALLVLAYCSSVCSGHAYIQMPAARNYNSQESCPHCYNAGGIKVVSNDGQYTWPEGVHGMCGDPAAGPLRHEAGGDRWTGLPTGTYSEGQVIDIAIYVSAFHKGRFGFRICRISGTDVASEKAQLTEACLNQNILKQANVLDTQAPGDPYFHLGQQKAPSGTVFRMRYQLPAGLTCNGSTAKCVLQWYYLTGNNCNPPGEPADYINPSMKTCGTSGALYPEEFWNCVDIRIFPAGTPLPPAPSPPPPARRG